MTTAHVYFSMSVCCIGNLLNDASTGQLAQLLVTNAATSCVSDLDLSMNAMLTWRCCESIAQLLSPSLEVIVNRNPSPLQQTADMITPSIPSDFVESGNSSALADAVVISQPNPVKLRRLCLEAVQLGDKGAALLAASLQTNNTLQVVSVARHCSKGTAWLYMARLRVACAA